MDSRNSGTLRANVVDIEARRIVVAEVRWADGRIIALDVRGPQRHGLPYLVPGFIDAHVHIESSLLPPTEFARLAVRHGTVACVSDPHEIANVLGVDGVHWMLAEARRTPFHFLFGAPSCVPATPFETAGAVLDADAVAGLLDTAGIGYLSEVMNFPGVLAGDAQLAAKIAAAWSRGLPVDGHAPGLVGDDAARYAAAGIGTDHECATLAEATGKIRAGMKILIREGSAARNFAALHPLIGSHPGQVMFCSDDRHPDDLVRGHINALAARAIGHGHDVFAVLEAACLTPQRHYGLQLGRLRVGDRMNAALVHDLARLRVLATWLDGVLVAENGVTLLPRTPCLPVNRFAAEAVTAAALRLPDPGGDCRVIVAEDGQLLTREQRVTPVVRDGFIVPSPADDVLLLAVVNRYRAAAPARALVRGFGLRRGALASSVAHDSHNVIAVGCDEESLAAAINGVISTHGGLAVAAGGVLVDMLPLPVAGLMSDGDGDAVAAHYAKLLLAARSYLGSPLRSPFMTLSFMALLVIPELKLSDQGLFDGRTFTFTSLAWPS